MKPTSLYEYNKVFSTYLDRFHGLPIDQITEEMVVAVYLENCKRSIAQSNKSMKILQAVLRYARKLPRQVDSSKVEFSSFWFA